MGVHYGHWLQVLKEDHAEQVQEVTKQLLLMKDDVYHFKVR